MQVHKIMPGANRLGRVFEEAVTVASHLVINQPRIRVQPVFVCFFQSLLPFLKRGSEILLNTYREVGAEHEKNSLNDWSSLSVESGPNKALCYF